MDRSKWTAADLLYFVLPNPPKKIHHSAKVRRVVFYYRLSQSGDTGASLTFNREMQAHEPNAGDNHQHGGYTEYMHANAFEAG